MSLRMVAAVGAVLIVGATVWAEEAASTNAPAAPVVADVKTISNGGAKVDMKDVLEPGKVTVVDFYADWCGPCRRMAPLLEALAAEDDEVVLRKVDIIKWGTPVCEQYAIDSVPNVRVFDRTGKQVGEATASLDAVKDAVRRAK